MQGDRPGATVGIVVGMGNDDRDGMRLKHGHILVPAAGTQQGAGTPVGEFRIAAPKWCNTAWMDEQLEGSKTALVIVNMQNGVMEYCVHPKKVASRIAELLGRARDTGTPVYWVQDEREFERHSTPWRMVAPLEPQDGEHRIFASYRDAFTGTGLHASLISQDVGRLVVCGAQSDYSLRTAAGRAAAMGYDVTVVRDAHTTGAATFEGQSLTGDQIIAHTNAYFASLDYPNQDFSLVRAAEIAFRAVPADD